VYGVALLLTLASGLLFGVAPIRQVLQANPYGIIKSGSTARAGRGITGRDVLLGVQIAMCAVLVTASLVAVRGLVRATHSNFGFQPREAMLAYTDLKMAGYSDPDAAALQKRMLAALEGIPGVQSAGLADQLPLQDCCNSSDVFTDQTADLRPVNVAAKAIFYKVSPEYFQAAGNAVVNLTWDPPNGQNPPQAPGGGTINPPPNTGVTATVTADVLNVRNGPGTGYDVLQTINNSATYPVVGRVADNSWLQLNANGVVGWSSGNYLNATGDLNTVPVINTGTTNPPPSGSTGVRVRAFANLHVRASPNSGSALLDNLAYGSDVDVIGRTADNSWLQVTYNNGVSNINGWIYSPYIRIISGSLLNVPVTG
jgi:uncharacterized protein YraI